MGSGGEKDQRLSPGPGALASGTIIAKFSPAIIEGGKCFRILARSINLEEGE